jgi:hypothetical protein
MASVSHLWIFFGLVLAVALLSAIEGWRTIG